ncbi:MAG: thiamine pyrophosphate-dependent enzyme [Spongiibacteraceae bacterium]
MNAIATTKTYTPSQPIWCAGCGHYGVKNALQYSMQALDIAGHETFVLAGIGCSGTIQNYIGAYGYHAMHGRVLPTATGVALANPHLTVIAAGGDGDGYAIGGGHLLHTFKRNPSMVYIVMNNAVYGLTKGQDSPTMPEPTAAPEEQALDAIQLGLSIRGTTFLARGFTSRPAQLNRLMMQALEHARAKRGLAFLEILSPCVTYNDTYPLWDAMVIDKDADENYDNTNRAQAMVTSLELSEQGRIPLGLLYRGDHPSYDSAFHRNAVTAPALEDVKAPQQQQLLRDILAEYKR